MTTLDDVVKLLQMTEEKRALERTKDKQELTVEKAKDKVERAEEIENLTKTSLVLLRLVLKKRLNLP